MLLLLMSLLPESSENGEQGIQLEKEVLDMIRDNSEVARRFVAVLNDLDFLMINELELESVSVQDFYKMLQEVIEGLNEVSKIKFQRVVLSSLSLEDKDVRVKINRPFIQRSFKEVILNALKYADKYSEIFVLFTTSASEIRLAFLSYCSKGHERALSPEHEREIFEPFFRLTSAVDDRYNTTELGLGLTFVDKSISRHGGKTFISGMADHFSRKNNTATLFGP